MAIFQGPKPGITGVSKHRGFKRISKQCLVHPDLGQVGEQLKQDSAGAWRSYSVACGPCVPSTAPPMGTAASLVSIVSGALSFVCTVASLCTDCWQVNSKGSVVLSMRCRGLWGECVWDKFVKIWTCDVFSSYLNPHPAAIIITRASLITAAITSAGAFFCLLAGCKYFLCCQEPTTKQRCLYLSVGFFLFAGLLSCVGVIRYCVYVFFRHQYEVSLRIPGFPSYEYGYSLWMAVAGNLAEIVAAATSYYQVVRNKVPNISPAKEHAGNGIGTTYTYV
ncbi:claudin-16-like [Tiliqua scincoides]|uniref:claudin-16-like n=1 Tax=Tiliqua scincoides TaxID=71010 RepID=UPI003461F7A8